MYKYEEIRPRLFTEDGQVMFLKIRDSVHHLLGVSGSFRMEEAITGFFGNTWDMIACVDRLVELGEIREITTGGVAGQHRVFVSTKN